MASEIISFVDIDWLRYGRFRADMGIRLADLLQLESYELTVTLSNPIALA